MRAFRQSSGDLIADRRYAHGAELAAAGDHAAAIPLFTGVVERAPGWAAGWHALARSRRDHFDPSGAIAAFRECLRLDPADALGASLELAQLDAAVRVDAAPAAYVAALFDAYAPAFDTTLVERLAYAAPTLIAARVRAAQPEATPHRFARALDLGCGTGLAGEALRRDIGYLEGVDIADGMLAQAREKGVYDSLVHGDLLSHLLAERDRFDLILASDVFTYMGDLSRVMKAIAGRLAPGGLVALALEKGAHADWAVGENLRFAHSEDYLRRVVRDAGLSVTALEDAVLRKDRGADVAGLVAILKLEPAATSVIGAVEVGAAGASCPQTEQAN